MSPSIAQSAGTAVDRSWPWLPLGLLAAAVLVFAISYVAGPGPSAAEEVNDTLDRFTVAAANSDGEEVCALATPAARRRFVGSLDRLSCPEVVRNFGIGVAGRQLRDAPRDEPRVAGDRATVEAPSIGVGFLLVRRDGEWRLQELQRFAARAPR